VGRRIIVINITKYLPLLALALGGCSDPSDQPLASIPESFVTARQGFKTKVDPPTERGKPADTAPPQIFATIKYPAVPGHLTAYVTPDPKDGKKHPAIVWITGGDCNSIGDVWTPAPADNDQTAAAYRKAGIVMMFPSLRGGNDNPGAKEGFYGEVDDVLAATDWLAKQPYVDPKRIYLGGHSTGGTLVMLVAESSPRYRSAFAFGPVEDVRGYGKDSGFVPFDLKDQEETYYRAPIMWLHNIAAPLWAIEGTKEGNLESLQAMKAEGTNQFTHFLAVQGATHFDVLAPTNRLIAQKILADTGETTNITLTEAELNQNFAKK
jgi:dipeptidyl aminopeptidase/acylaminoacyl peptidase